jgi:serine/threonine protein kinase
MVGMLDSFYIDGPNDTHLVMALEPLGSLRDLQELDSALYFAHTADFVRQMVQGVAQLHELGIAHRGEFKVWPSNDADGKLSRPPFGQFRLVYARASQQINWAPSRSTLTRA